MKEAYIFPGQGSQFVGMGKELFNSNEKAKQLFLLANKVLDFEISKIMFDGSIEDLKQTKVTQPAVFIHSVIAYKSANLKNPDMVAGHSLGEFSALVCNKTLQFEDALKLVLIRAQAMQKACDNQESTMVAVLGMDDEQVNQICKSITNEIVVVANFNCPGQVIISGTKNGITIASELLKNAGAKRCLPLPVSGAFHSPLMKSAEQELADAINNTQFLIPTCPIYQNINAKPENNPDTIKQNLIHQLTGAVRWTETINNMVADGATNFTELGPGKVLQGLVNKINNTVTTTSIS